MTEENLGTIVELDEKSQLKADLNSGVSSLSKAEENYFQPHVCLNEKDGVKVIDRISQDPAGANTEFSLRCCLINSGSDAWLNVRFSVFIDEICYPTNHVLLTPRQTSYIVQRLPKESQQQVLRAVRAWYVGHFLKNMQKAMETITTQIEEGDLLLESDHNNRVFDIHGGWRSMDVPYTEWDIVGQNIAPLFLFGVTLFDREGDGYRRADDFLRSSDMRREDAIEGTLELVRTLGIVGSDKP